MSTNLALQMHNNIIEVDFKPRRSTSLYKKDGIRKASAADPIRSLEHIKAIQKYFTDRDQIRNYTIFTLGILYGLRAGDLLSLKVSNFYNENGSFKLHCDLYEEKTRKFNNPIISKQIQNLISAYIIGSDLKLDYHDPLFPSKKKNENGNRRPITISQYNRILKEAVTACDIPGHISSHSMRKTFVYHMIRNNPGNGELLIAIQKMLNHSSFQTTLTYCGIEQDSIDKYRYGLEEGLL